MVCWFKKVIDVMEVTSNKSTTFHPKINNKSLLVIQQHWNIHYKNPAGPEQQSITLETEPNEQPIQQIGNVNGRQTNESFLPIITQIGILRFRIGCILWMNVYFILWKVCFYQQASSQKTITKLQYTGDCLHCYMTLPSAKPWYSRNLL